MIRPYSRNSSWDVILRPFALFAAILLFFGCGYAALGSLRPFLFFVFRKHDTMCYKRGRT
jgi:hypothetical protein